MASAASPIECWLAPVPMAAPAASAASRGAVARVEEHRRHQERGHGGADHYYEVHGDTVPIPIRQATVEQGGTFWSPASGLVRRTRDIIIITS